MSEQLGYEPEEPLVTNLEAHIVFGIRTDDIRHYHPNPKEVLRLDIPHQGATENGDFF